MLKVNEKKKAQRAAKREKEKVAKVEEQKVQAGEEERQRFLHLTDREKRALAAERRLLGRCLLNITFSNASLDKVGNLWQNWR